MYIDISPILFQLDLNRHYNPVVFYAFEKQQVDSLIEFIVGCIPSWIGFDHDAIEYECSHWVDWLDSYISPPDPAVNTEQLWPVVRNILTVVCPLIKQEVYDKIVYDTRWITPRLLWLDIRDEDGSATP